MLYTTKYAFIVTNPLTNYSLATKENDQIKKKTLKVPLWLSLVNNLEVCDKQYLYI